MRTWLNPCTKYLPLTLPIFPYNLVGSGCHLTTLTYLLHPKTLHHISIPSPTLSRFNIPCKLPPPAESLINFNSTMVFIFPKISHMYKTALIPFSIALLVRLQMQYILGDKNHKETHGGYYD